MTYSESVKCDHDWRRVWTDGITGLTRCTKCQKGVLVPVGDVAWWGTKSEDGKD
jgi:hypothetical protein